MSETGFKCPKCGNTEHFTASMVVATFYDCDISPDGWDYFRNSCEVDLADSSTMMCWECGYEDSYGNFEEE